MSYVDGMFMLVVMVVFWCVYMMFFMDSSFIMSSSVERMIFSYRWFEDLFYLVLILFIVVNVNGVCWDVMYVVILV